MTFEQANGNHFFVIGIARESAWAHPNPYLNTLQQIQSTRLYNAMNLPIVQAAYCNFLILVGSNPTDDPSLWLSG